MNLVMIEENLRLEKEIPHYDIKNAFGELSLADPHLGILGICPQELHFMETCNYSNIIITVM